MKELKDVIVLLAVLIYDITLLAGTAYMVEEHQWSMWVFALTMFFFMVPRDKDEKKSDESPAA